MPVAKKKTAKTKKPVAAPPPPPTPMTAPLPPSPFTMPPVAPTTPPPTTPTGVVTITVVQRDALVTRLLEAERQFLGGFPLGAKPMIAEVAAKLKAL